MMTSSNTQISAESVHWTEYGIPIRNLWHMLLYAWNEVPIANRWFSEDVEDAPTLDALLTRMLAKLIQQRLRIGLGCNYVDEAQALRGIRGRLDFTESLKRRTFDRGRAFCEFQQYSPNAPKNQIVRSTLARLVQIGQFGPDAALAENLRHKLRWLTRLLDGVDLIELKLDFIRRQQLGRNDGDYRLMLAICELLLQRQMPTDSTGLHGLPAIERDALILHQIYEHFVANFYRVQLGGWKVIPKQRLGWHEKSPNQYMPIMVPDLTLEEKSTGQLVLLDTKFTARSISVNQWGKQLFDSGHLYQMYAYLKSQEHLSESHQAASGILLYPAVHQHLSESVGLQNHALRIECVDLAAPWQDIEHRLLDLVLAGGLL
jgi:5-methylcytosine-specific restriction enzyme subunit McrC